MAETTVQFASTGSRKRLPFGAFIGVATVAALLALWAAASGLGWTSPVFLPSPARVADAIVTAATSGYANATLWQHMAASLWRVFAALVCTLAIGVPAGLLIATSRVGRGILDPLIEFIRPLPPLAYLPLIIIGAVSARRPRSSSSVSPCWPPSSSPPCPASARRARARSAPPVPSAQLRGR